MWDQDLLSLLGYIPNEALRWGGLTALTSFFVHADYGHLLSNLYMFGVFGDNVEDVLGWRFLLLLILGTLLGVAFHHVTTDASDAVLVGASTGISAIVTYYALSFPRQQFSLVFLFFLWVRIPVFFYVLVWVGLQFIGTLMAQEQLVATSFAGHIGGALAGVIFWLVGKFTKAFKAGAL